MAATGQKSNISRIPPPAATAAGRLAQAERRRDTLRLERQITADDLARIGAERAEAVIAGAKADDTASLREAAHRAGQRIEELDSAIQRAEEIVAEARAAAEAEARVAAVAVEVSGYRTQADAVDKIAAHVAAIVDIAAGAGPGGLSAGLAVAVADALRSAVTVAAAGRPSDWRRELDEAARRLRATADQLAGTGPAALPPVEAPPADTLMAVHRRLKWTAVDGTRHYMPAATWVLVPAAIAARAVALGAATIKPESTIRVEMIRAHALGAGEEAKTYHAGWRGALARDVALAALAAGAARRREALDEAEYLALMKSDKPADRGGLEIDLGDLAEILRADAAPEAAA